MCNDREMLNEDIKQNICASIIKQLAGTELPCGSEYILHELNEYQLRKVLSFIRSFNKGD